MPEGLLQNLTDQDLVDLLAFLATLKQPAVIVADWRILGSADGGKYIQFVQEQIKKPSIGTEKERARWRKLSADREGRVDLEGALGARKAGALMRSVVQSKGEQSARLVVLAPAGVALSASLNGKEVSAGTVPKPGGDTKTLAPTTFPVRLKVGKNELLLGVIGNDQAQLTVVVTLVSPQGVESPAPE